MKKLLLSICIVGFASHSFAATIFIVEKNKPTPVDGVRFDLCSNGKIAYSQVTVIKEYPVVKQASQNGCSGKSFINPKSPKSIFTNDEVTTLKIDSIEIKSSNQAFADVLADRINLLQSEQPEFQKKLVGVLVFNQEIGEGSDKKTQAKIVLHLGDPASPTLENRVFNE